MKWLQWLGLPVGIAILIGLAVHDGARDVVRVIGAAGPVLLWLVPFHALPLLLDAHAWRLLLDKRAPLGFLWWVATVREAVNRLLPVVGVGGEIVGVRLARWKLRADGDGGDGRDMSRVTASVIVEVFVTIAVQYAFSALGVVLIVAATGDGGSLRTIVTIALALLLTAPLPVLAVFLLRRGGVFHAIERWAARLLGANNPLMMGIDGKQLDADLDQLMSRTGLMFRAFFWQLGGYMLGAFETWWALTLLGHPVTVGEALAIEAITQAVRHAAFMVPAGLGVQEVAVVLLAQLFGVSPDVALSLALVKRMREMVFGVLALLSWQTAEIVRTRHLLCDSKRAAAAAASEARPAEAGARARASQALHEPHSNSKARHDQPH